MTADDRPLLDRLYLFAAAGEGEFEAGMCLTLSSAMAAAQACGEAAAEIERQAAEIERLRQIVSDCASAIGNGAFAKPECSLEFMETVPAEIAAVAKLRAAEIERLRAGAWRPIDDEARNGEPWIVCNRDGQRSVGEYEGRFGDDIWCTHDGYWLGSDVIAYAPLPPPPSTSGVEG